MSYSVKNNKLIGPNVTYVNTKKKSGKIKPKFLVIHYTASDNYEGDVRTLSTSDRPASCQLVIAPDGRVTQIGALNDKMWHAGKSAWRGYSMLNSYSIGIEVTCPGPLTGDKTWYGKKLVDGEPFPFINAAHKNGGKVQNWAGFTDAQIDAVIDIGSALMKAYKLEEAVGHDDISPGRKIDPGPSCPDSVFHALNGNRIEEDEPERPELNSVDGARRIVVGVAPDRLNFRASPNGQIRGQLPENTKVDLLAVRGEWAQVRTPAGYVGWVHNDYIKPV